MGTIIDQINTAFRDFITDGVSSSGPHEVVKAEVRAIGPIIEEAIGNAGLAALVSVTKTTKALLDADLAHAANAVALVYADPTDANNDLYIKVGASGTGSWTLTTILHDIIESVARPWSDLAQAWANGSSPGGVGTKSAREYSLDAATYADNARDAADVSVASSTQYPSEAAAVAALGNGAYGSYLDAAGKPVWGQRTGSTMTPLPGPWIDASKVGVQLSGAGTVLRDILEKQLREPEDHDVDYSGSSADTTRLANFFASARNEVFRNGGRQFLGDAAGFNGVWGNYDDYTGLSPLTRGLHNWGPRDSQLFIDSSWGALTIVGSSQASKGANWPGHPSFVPASIPVSGFCIVDVNQGQGWGGYFDCVVMPGLTDTFNVAVETAFANFSSPTKMTPYNVVDGSARGGVGLWLQSGAGLDRIEADLARVGLSARDVNHMSAHMVALSSYQQLGVANWANSTTYGVGTRSRDPVTDIVWQCMVAHTSPASGDMVADRLANPTRWKQIPAAYSGLIFASSSLVELVPGSDIYSAIELAERQQIGGYRLNGSGVVEQSFTIYGDRIPDGSPVVPLVFRQGQIWSSAMWSGNADGSTGAKIQGRGSGNVISFRWNDSGLGSIEIYVDNILVKTI